MGLWDASVKRVKKLGLGGVFRRVLTQLAPEAVNAGPETAPSAAGRGWPDVLGTAGLASLVGARKIGALGRGRRRSRWHRRRTCLRRCGVVRQRDGKRLIPDIPTQQTAGGPDDNRAPKVGLIALSNRFTNARRPTQIGPDVMPFNATRRDHCSVA